MRNQLAYMYVTLAVVDVPQYIYINHHDN